MFGWFRSKARKAETSALEAQWSLGCAGEILQVTDDKQRTQKLAKSDLSAVIIQTNDSGPWGADVWWLLYGPDAQVAAAFPQGATGEDAMLAYLMSLPGFDSAKMIDAMGCVENAVFPVWQSPR